MTTSGETKICRNRRHLVTVPKSTEEDTLPPNIVADGTDLCNTDTDEEPTQDMPNSEETTLEVQNRED